MKINWKVRLKNPMVWITAFPTIVTAIYALLALLGIVPSITKETIMDVFTAIVSLLATLGIIADPTTPGVSDSDRAMSYTKPGGGVEDADV